MRTRGEDACGSAAVGTTVAQVAPTCCKKSQEQSQAHRLDMVILGEGRSQVGLGGIFVWWMMVQRAPHSNLPGRRSNQDSS